MTFKETVAALAQNLNVEIDVEGDAKLWGQTPRNRCKIGLPRGLSPKIRGVCPQKSTPPSPENL